MPKPQATYWQPVAIVLAALVGSAWFLIAENRIAGMWGFPLDDSWIYATFARNLANGHGYSFNPGESITGATGPLYVIILALLYLIFRDVIWPAKVLGILCFGASCLVLYQTVRRILPGNRFLPLLAGLLVALSPPLLWGSLTGLELPVYLLLACMGMYFYVDEKWTLAILCWCIGVWLRPDGLFLVLLGVLLRPKVSLKNSIAPLAVAVATLGGYFAFNYLVGGQVLPNSVHIKAHAGWNHGASEYSMLQQWADLWGVWADPLGLSGNGRVGLHAPLVLAGAVAGSIVSFRRWPALVAYAFLFPFAFAFFGPSGGQFARYIVYVVPFTVLLASAGFDWAAGLALGGQRALAGLIIVGVVCLAWEGHVARQMGIGHGWNVQNINGMQRFVAEAARRGTSPGDTIAVNDVGAMGFFSDCYVVDLVGLVSPTHPFPETLRLYRPKYLAIFPEWFQQFASVERSTGQQVFYDTDSVYKYSPFLGVRLRRNTISSHSTMYVYERKRRLEPGTSTVPVVVH